MIFKYCNAEIVAKKSWIINRKSSQMYDTEIRGLFYFCHITSFAWNEVAIVGSGICQVVEQIFKRTLTV